MESTNNAAATLALPNQLPIKGGKHGLYRLYLAARVSKHVSKLVSEQLDRFAGRGRHTTAARLVLYCTRVSKDEAEALKKEIEEAGGKATLK